MCGDDGEGLLAVGARHSRHRNSYAGALTGTLVLEVRHKWEERKSGVYISTLSVINCLSAEKVLCAGEKLLRRCSHRYCT